LGAEVGLCLEDFFAIFSPIFVRYYFCETDQFGFLDSVGGKGGELKKKSSKVISNFSGKRRTTTTTKSQQQQQQQQQQVQVPWRGDVVYVRHEALFIIK
jgi:hypothetical protein